jgi:hypothetical protein
MQLLQTRFHVEPWGDDDWCIVDSSVEPCEFNNGMLAYGFDTREEAEAWLRAYRTGTASLWGRGDGVGETRQ